MILRRLLVCLVPFVVSSSFAQFQHVQKNGSVRVQVLFTDGQPCNLQVRVTLWTKAGSTPLTQASATNNCRADFSSLAAGNYYVQVAGAGIETAESPVFEVGGTTQSIDIAVRRTEPERGAQTPTVSVTELNIPNKARKEFDKASALMDKKDWDKALEHLSKAVAIFPQYAAAYNNMGVVYARLGDRIRERDALQKALGVNDHFAPALTNLASMALVDRNLAEAEALLGRVTAIGPQNAATLVLLAKLQLLNQHYEAAIATCHKVHTMQHNAQSLVHYIAARALEGQHRNAEAVTELHTFLQEQPSGSGAELARKEMAVLENGPR